MAVVCGTFSACSGDDDLIENVTTSDVAGTWYLQQTELSLDGRDLPDDLYYALSEVVQNEIKRFKGEIELKDDGTTVMKLPTSGETGTVRLTLNTDETWYQEYAASDNYWVATKYDFTALGGSGTTQIAPYGVQFDEINRTSYYIRGNTISFVDASSSTIKKNDYQNDKSITTDRIYRMDKGNWGTDNGYGSYSFIIRYTLKINYLEK